MQRLSLIVIIIYLSGGLRAQPEIKLYDLNVYHVEGPNCYAQKIFSNNKRLVVNTDHVLSIYENDKWQHIAFQLDDNPYLNTLAFIEDTLWVSGGGMFQKLMSYCDGKLQVYNGYEGISWMSNGPDKTIWFGGMYAESGFNFINGGKIFTIENPYDTIPDLMLFAAFSSGDSLWFGTNYGIIKYYNSKWDFIGLPDLIPSEDYINSICSDNNNCIWVTSSKGVYQYHNNIFTPIILPFTQNGHYASKVIRGANSEIIITIDNELFPSENTYFFQISDETITTVQMPTFYTNGEVTFWNDSLWFISPTNLWAYKNNQYKKYENNWILYPLGFTAYGNGNFAFTGSKIVMYHNETWLEFNSSPEFTYYGLSVDKNDNLIASGKKLSIFKNNQCIMLDSMDNEHIIYTALEGFVPGTYWLGGRQWVALKNGNQWTEFNPNNSLVKWNITQGIIGESGNCYFLDHDSEGSNNTHLLKVDTALNMTRIFYPSDIKRLLAFNEDKTGKLWIAGRNNNNISFYIQNGTNNWLPIKLSTPYNPDLSQTISCIINGINNDIWLAGGGQIFHYDSDMDTTSYSCDDLIVYGISKLSIDKLGNIYAVSNGVGIIKLEFNTAVNDYQFVKLKTWPNPAIDFTIVELPKSGNYLCQLYNMQGELIYEQTVSGKTWQVEFEGFQPGVYIATALSESGLKYSQKIVKNK